MIDSTAAAATREPGLNEEATGRSGCNTVCVALDFEKKTLDTIGLERVKPAMAAGQYVWLDVDFNEVAEARRVLSSLGLVARHPIRTPCKGRPRHCSRPGGP